MRSLEPGGCAVVVGASGGIGAALVAALLDDPAFATVVALGRGFGDPRGDDAGRLRYGPIDITEEASIDAAAQRLAAPIRLVIVATGVLHGPTGTRHDGFVLRPERSYRGLDADALIASYRVNAVGPALVAKHLLPRMASPGRSVFATLSARVGSIGDNRLGGWHAYRASKAALNMIIRNLAIETARRSPETLCVGLHPGTVDTALSAPFQGAVAADRLFAPAMAAARLLAVVDGLEASHNGSVLAWDGSTVPP